MWRSMRCAVLVLGLSAAVLACAPEPPEEADRAGPPQRMKDNDYYVWSPDAAWEGKEGPPVYVCLPTAVNGTVYNRDHWKATHLVLVLAADGTVVGHGRPGTEEAHDSLARAMEALARSAGSTPPVLIRSPQAVSWSRVASVLATALGDALGADSIQIDLGQAWGQARRLDLRRIPNSPAPSPDASVRLSGETGNGTRWVRLETAGNRFDFPLDWVGAGSLEGFHDRFDGFDAVWWDVQQVLTEAVGDRRAAEVLVDEEVAPVALAYVVSLLDVLIDAGYRTVSFPSEGPTFRIEPPPFHESYAPPRAVPEWVLLSSALGVVLAFTVTLGSVGRSRRSRRARRPA
jgi:biopolymer transport protein ExbD